MQSVAGRCTDYAIPALFIDAVDSSDYKSSKKSEYQNELERTWKEAVNESEALAPPLLGATEEINENARSVEPVTRPKFGLRTSRIRS
jgi:hypothetical protein